MVEQLPSVQPRKTITPPLPTTLFCPFRVQFNGTCEGQNVQNVFHYRNTVASSTPPTYTEMQLLMSALFATGGMIATYINCMAADYMLTNVLIDSPAFSTTPGIAEAVSSAGTVAQKTVPLNCCVLIAKYTPIRTRSGRGRVRLPACPQTWTSRSTLTNNTAHDQFATSMMSQPTAGSAVFVPGIWSKHGYDPLTDEGGWADLSSTVLRVRLGSCRRRLPPWDYAGP